MFSIIVNVDTLILRSHDSEWTPTPTPMGALIICNLVILPVFTYMSGCRQVKVDSVVKPLVSLATMNGFGCLLVNVSSCSKNLEKKKMYIS